MAHVSLALSHGGCSRRVSSWEGLGVKGLEVYALEV